MGNYVGNVNGLVGIEVTIFVNIQRGADAEDVVYKDNYIGDIYYAIEIHIAFLSVDRKEIYFVEPILLGILIRCIQSDTFVGKRDVHSRLQRSDGSLWIIHRVGVEHGWIVGTVCSL